MNEEDFWRIFKREIEGAQEKYGDKIKFTNH